MIEKAMLARARQLMEDSDNKLLELGQLIIKVREISDVRTFCGKIGLGYRKGCLLVNIAHSVERGVLLASDITAIGWAKCATIAQSDLKKGTEARKAVRFAATHTVKQLLEYLGKSKAASTITFSLTKDEKKQLEHALLEFGVNRTEALLTLVHTALTASKPEIATRKAPKARAAHAEQAST